ncbi:hypothetical protein ACF0H5_009084 [Mactra antiquata]
MLIYALEQGGCAWISDNFGNPRTTWCLPKSFCWRPDEYKPLEEPISAVAKALPELDRVVPCYQQSDHMNQLGRLQYSECIPDDCELEYQDHVLKFVTSQFLQ